MENRIKLITALGTRRYDPCRYYIEGDRGRTSSVTRFAAMGLAELAVECGQPLEIVALETARVKDSDNHKLLHEEFEEKRSVGGRAWELRVEEIPDGKDKEELWQIFETLGKHIEQGDHIIIDITNGFRSLPTVMISAAQYYLYLNKAADLKIYYGAFESVGNTQGTAGQGREGGTPEVPIIDITLITSISDWTYGLRLFDEHLITLPLADQLKRTAMQEDKALCEIAQIIRSLDFYLRSALPLEAGLVASRLYSKINELNEPYFKKSIIGQFLSKLRDTLKGIKLDVSEKQEIALNREELLRQSELIERYLAVNDLNSAIVILREWLVSFCIWADGDQNKIHKWRTNSIRKKYSSKLNENKGIQNIHVFQKLRQLWEDEGIKNIRNTFAHAAIQEDEEVFSSPEEETKRIGKSVKNLRRLLEENET